MKLSQCRLARPLRAMLREERVDATAGDRSTVADVLALGRLHDREDGEARRPLDRKVCSNDIQPQTLSMLQSSAARSREARRRRPGCSGTFRRTGGHTRYRPHLDASRTRLTSRVFQNPRRCCVACGEGHCILADACWSSSSTAAETLDSRHPALINTRRARPSAEDGGRS